MNDQPASGDASSLPQGSLSPPAGLTLATAADLQDHLMTATNDLDRLQTLLEDASDTLMHRFHNVMAEVQTLRNQWTPRPSDEPAALGAAMQQLAGAVTALQFQDMASQLLVHTSRRLRNCADQLARETMGDDEDGVAVVETAPLRPNPVTQAEMDAGSVELF
jgi:hypothetical protein